MMIDRYTPQPTHHQPYAAETEWGDQGLVHVSEYAWARVPSALGVFDLGQQVEMVCLANEHKARGAMAILYIHIGIRIHHN